MIVFLNLFLLMFSSKRDNELLLRLIANLNMLLRDDSVNVVKKAILTLTQLYKVTLQVNTLLIYQIFSFLDFALAQRNLCRSDFEEYTSKSSHYYQYLSYLILSFLTLLPFSR